MVDTLKKAENRLFEKVKRLDVKTRMSMIGEIKDIHRFYAESLSEMVKAGQPINPVDVNRQEALSWVIRLAYAVSDLEREVARRDRSRRAIQGYETPGQ